jgi:hypothetical protein
MPRWMKRTFYVLGIAFMLLPVILFVHGTIRTWSANQWPVAEGRVVATRVETSTSSERDGDTIYSYDPIVTFDYVVGGRRYRSERLFLNQHELYDWEPDARAELGAYPVGSPIHVSYNPNDPQDAAVIIEGPTLWLFLFWVFGLGLLLPARFIPDEGRLQRIPSVRFRTRNDRR